MMEDQDYSDFNVSDYDSDHERNQSESEQSIAQDQSDDENVKVLLLI